MTTTFSNQEVAVLKALIAERRVASANNAARWRQHTTTQKVVELNADCAQGATAEAELLGDSLASPVKTGRTMTVANPLGPDLSAGDRVVVTKSLFQNESRYWYPAGAGATAGGVSVECMCELIALLESVNHLSEITDEQWTSLKTTCKCGGATVTCSNCVNDEASENYSLALSGVTAASGGLLPPPAGDKQLAVDYLNQTHTLTPHPTIACRWEHIHQITEGTQLIDIAITMTIEPTGVQMAINADWNQNPPGDVGQWNYNAAAPHDCLNDLVLGFTSQVPDFDSPLVVYPTSAQTLSPAAAAKPEDDMVKFKGKHEQGAIAVNQTMQTNYTKFDMVTDEAWLAIANKTTTDRAAPQRIGLERSVIEIPGPPSFSTSQLNEAAAYVGSRYTWASDGYFNSVRLWIPGSLVGNFSAEMFLVIDPDNSDGERQIVTVINRFPITGSTTVDGWATYPIGAQLIPQGTEFDLVAAYYRTGTSNTFSGDWNYVRTNGAPSSGQLAARNNDAGDWRLHFEDDSGTNRESDLDNLHAGATILMNGTEYTILDISKGASDYSINVSPATAQSTGLYTLDFEWQGQVPIDYVSDAGHYASLPAVESFAAGSYDYSPSLSDMAVGVDVIVQDAQISPDWDLLSAP